MTHQSVVHRVVDAIDPPWIEADQSGRDLRDPGANTPCMGGYVSFRRTITLPQDTPRSSISASLEDGLLEITVAKGCVARREPERIDIRVGGGDR